MKITRIILASSIFIGAVMACSANSSELSFNDLEEDLEYVLELIANRELSDEGEAFWRW